MASLLLLLKRNSGYSVDGERAADAQLRVSSMAVDSAGDITSPIRQFLYTPVTKRDDHTVAGGNEEGHQVMAARLRCTT